MGSSGSPSPPALQHAGVERLHRPALAAVAVVQVVAAEHLDDLVDDVRVRRRRAPGVVLAAADEDVERDAGERGAARVDAAAVQVELHQDLRDRGGRSAARRRRAGGRVAERVAPDEQRVAHARRADRAPAVRATARGCRRRAAAFPRSLVRAVAYGKRPGTAVRRLRVVELAEVVPDASRPRSAPSRPAARRRNCARPRLVAAARAEHGADQRRHGDHVVRASRRMSSPARRLYALIPAT